MKGRKSVGKGGWGKVKGERSRVKGKSQWGKEDGERSRVKGER